jgi:hypothetical protein
MVDTFDWLKPSPLWQDDGSDIRELQFRYFRPRILEFQSDDFVQDFLTIAGSQPRNLDGYAVISDETNPRTLYLPNHGCFYLVSASLCCREPHAPDRQIQPAFEESVFFVLRKRIGTAEYGWIPVGPSKGWQPLTSGGRSTLEGEQPLPLTPAVTATGRAIWFGYLSLTSSESYAASPERLAEISGSTPDDTRPMELQARFSGMLKNLPTQSEITKAQGPSDIRTTMSVFLLLDLWEYLAEPEVLPDIATALRDHPEATFDADPEKAALMAFLVKQLLPSGMSLATALTNVARKQHELELPQADPSKLGFTDQYDLQGEQAWTSALYDRVVAALPAATQPPVELPKLDMKPDSRYVVRCIYSRPQCPEEPAIVSLATDPFLIARFFDPDAPVRPVKIPMPTDVSLAGLRKFKKGVGFMLSPALYNKTKMVGLGALENPPSLDPEGSDTLAFICSFSIQIVFIIALFLLLIFAIVLNFVFWWMAFFKICLPVPSGLVKES